MSTSETPAKPRGLHQELLARTQGRGALLNPRRRLGERLGRREQALRDPALRRAAGGTEALAQLTGGVGERLGRVPQLLLATRLAALAAGTALAAGLSSTWFLLVWQVRRQAQNLPLMLVVQTALACSTVLGYGILIGDVPQEAALFLATGAPTITLITVGLVMTPQQMSQSRLEGSAEWLRTLPVPRAAFLAADLAVWTVIALPGLVLGAAVGEIRYDVSFQVQWWIVPLAVLVSLTAAAIGYAFAVLLAPMMVILLTQLLIFLLLLFSPISFPAANMPQWLQRAHEVLPIEPMANLMRAGLAGQSFTADARDLLVVALWCAGALTVALLALRRRG